MTQVKTNWREVIEVTVRECALRRIGIDSDGNRYRIAYADGVIDAAIAAVEKQTNRHAAGVALEAELTKFECRLYGPGELQTS